MKSALTDAARAAVAAIIALYISQGVAVFDLGSEGWKALAAAGITAGLTVVLRWLQPGGDYGMGSGS